MYGVFCLEPDHPPPDLGLEIAVSDRPFRLFRAPGLQPHCDMFRSDRWIAARYGELYEAPPLVSVDRCSEQGSQPLPDIASAVVAPDAEALASLNGSFVIVLYDRQEHVLYLVSDRYGTKRLFYLNTPEAFWFFPQLHFFKGLPVSFDAHRQLTTEYLAFRYLVRQRTFLQGVVQMRPGTVVKVDSSGCSECSYWRWSFAEETAPVGAECDGESDRWPEMGERLVRAVERRVAGKDHLLLPLSGGLDSRAVLGAALESKAAGQLTAVSYGTPGTLDFEIGRIVASHVGVRHLALDLTGPKKWSEEYTRQCLDMNGSVEPFFQVFLADWQRVTDVAETVLSGYLGETITGAHIRQSEMRGVSAESFDFDQNYKHLLEKHLCISPDLVSQLMSDDERHTWGHLLELMKTTMEGNRHVHMANWSDCWDLSYRQSKYIIPAVLKLEDRLLYALPFTDNEFVDFCLRLPPALRFGQKLYRTMLQNRFPKLFALPVKNDGGAPLRGSLSYRLGWMAARVLRFSGSEREFAAKWFGLKLGKSPGLNTVHVADWIRADSPFVTYFEGLIRGIGRRGVVDPNVVQRLFHAHRDGTADFATALACLAGVELSYRCFVEDH